MPSMGYRDGREGRHWCAQAYLQLREPGFQFLMNVPGSDAMSRLTCILRARDVISHGCMFRSAVSSSLLTVASRLCPMGGGAPGRSHRARVRPVSKLWDGVDVVASDWMAGQDGDLKLDGLSAAGLSRWQVIVAWVAALSDGRFHSPSSLYDLRGAMAGASHHPTIRFLGCDAPEEWRLRA